ncbi:MFS transporter [Novosphingobium sp. SL115]|uniref:MFS transporter n=1 Tax=Novosphingobium sp. SL115 TaxID=2995150 RepID=UPI0022727FD3|nr:MFS transporter [Novosphingobium sp. SL115]MCY1670355.1 MFS transporter [Novosphingobium sp. SL115]
MTESPIRLPKERMALLFAVMLVTAAGNTAMQSVMPSIGTRLGIADVWVSLAYSWSALLWVIMAPFWARRSDRRGRKAMMALGIIGFILSFTFCGAVLHFGLDGWFGAVLTMSLFAMARSFYGLFGSAAPPAVQAYVASRTDRTERTKALSMVASSFGLGTVLGPALAPLMILPGLGLVGPFAVFALVGVIVLVLLRTRLPDDDPRFAARGEVMSAPFSASSNPRIVEENPDASPDELPEAEPQHDGADRLRWSDRRIRPWLIAGLIGGHSQAMLLGIIGFLLLDRLGLRGDPNAGAGPVGLVLMSGAIATLLAQWGLIPMLGLGPRTSTLWGMSLAAVGIIPVALGQDLHTIALGFAVASVGFGLFRPGFTSGASLAVSPREQGQSAGIIAAVNGAAYITAPAIGVWFYNHSQWLAWGVMEVLALSVVVLCLVVVDKDEDTAGTRPRR